MLAGKKGFNILFIIKNIIIGYGSQVFTVDICTPVANNCGNRGSQLEDVNALFHFQNPTPVHEATLLDAATDLKGLYLPRMRF